jgi:hypothetical protein
MCPTRSGEPGGGGAEHELQHLPALAANLEAPSLLVNRQHRAPLEAAAEVGDPCRGTDPGDWS